MTWFSFKQTLFNLMDKHIPEIKVGGLPRPSRFDAQVHHAYREKDRLHQIDKGTLDSSYACKDLCLRCVCTYCVSTTA